jgi:hypothetical protein
VSHTTGFGRYAPRLSRPKKSARFSSRAIGVLPGLPVDSGGGVPPQAEGRRSQTVDVVDMVQERHEPHRLIPLRDVPYPLLVRLPFAQSPSLPSSLPPVPPGLVRDLRGYNGAGRPPVTVQHRRVSLDFPMRRAVPSTWSNHRLSRFSREV